MFWAVHVGGVLQLDNPCPRRSLGINAFSPGIRKYSALDPDPISSWKSNKSITAQKVSNKYLNIYSSLVEFKNENNLSGVIATWDILARIGTGPDSIEEVGDFLNLN